MRVLGRAGAVCAATLAAVLATLLLVPARAQSEFVQGSGRAAASVIRFGPSTGRLSLAPQVGIALADYTGTVGRGESRVVDFAALDGSVREEIKAELPTVRVASTDPGAAKGQERTVGDAGAQEADAGVSRQWAAATDAPVGQSTYSLASLSIPGLIEARGLHAAAAAGVAKADATREARGETVVDSLSLLGGKVVLRGLRWDATQRTGEGAATEGSFTVGSVVIQGQGVAVPAGGDLAPLVGPINAALAPSGVVIDLPKATSEAGVARVSPLAVRIVDSTLGRQLLAPVLAGARPVRDPVARFIFERASEASGLVLVGDTVVGVASGAGRLDLEIGGTSAFTEGEAFESPFQFDFGSGDADGGFAFAGEDSTGFGALGEAGSTSALGEGGAEAGGSTAAGAPGAASATPARNTSTGGKRGGAAAAVGALGLLAALAVGAADYRAMRGARRIVPIP